MSASNTPPLPCDDALQGLRGLRAEVAETLQGILAQLDIRIDALAKCQPHCWRHANAAQDPRRSATPVVIPLDGGHAERLDGRHSGVTREGE